MRNAGRYVLYLSGYLFNCVFNNTHELYFMVNNHVLYRSIRFTKTF